MVGIFDQAVAAYFQSNGRKVSQQSALNACIADFNKSVKIRKFKVDTVKRKIITNLLRTPKESVAILAQHYDLHKHSSSGAHFHPFMSMTCQWTMCNMFACESVCKLLDGCSYVRASTNTNKWKLCKTNGNLMTKS